MPIVEHADQREERDNYLVVTSVVSAASALMRGFQDWVEEELRELIPKLEVELARIGTDCQMGERLNRALLRMRDIEKRECPDCTADLKTRIKEVSDGAYDSVIDARRYVEPPCNRFENIVQELLDYRQLVDSLE